MYIQFLGGESRYGTQAVNYLINTSFKNNDSYSPLVYAEVDVPEDCTEYYGYINMKKALVDNLPEDVLSTIEWWYPEEIEPYLSDDASTDCTVRIEINIDGYAEIEKEV